MANSRRPVVGSIGQIHFGIAASGMLGLVCDLTEDDGLHPKFLRCGWLVPSVASDAIRDLLSVGHAVFFQITKVEAFLYDGKEDNYHFSFAFVTEDGHGQTVRKHPIVFGIPRATPLRYGWAEHDPRYPEMLVTHPIYFSKNTRGYKIAKVLQARGLPYSTEDVYRFVQQKEGQKARVSIIFLITTLVSRVVWTG